MIAVAQAKDSSRILKFNDRHICSSVNPKAEAMRWIEKNHDRMSRQKKAVVLGVGCGFHLVAMQKHFPALKILAIDTMGPFIEFTKQEHGLDIGDVQFITAVDIDEIFKNKCFNKFASDRFGVFKFIPTTHVDKIKYTEFEKVLVGRSPLSAQFIKKFRPGIYELFTRAVENLQTTQLVSIKNIAEEIQHNTARELILKIKILGEMVK